MTTENTSTLATITNNNPLVTSAGRIVAFKTWAEENGYDTSDKAERKTAMKEYDALKLPAQRALQAHAAALLSAKGFEVRKMKPVFKDGELAGGEISVRREKAVKSSAKKKGNPMRVAAENLAAHLGVSVDRAMEFLNGGGSK